MADKNKIVQPGVTVTQVQRTQSPNIFSPSLVPFVTGPAKEIVNAFDDLGGLNPKALQGNYTQLPKTISQTSFPSPRGNIAEVTVERPTIRAFFDFANQQTEQIRDPGESFLVAKNIAQRATIRSKQEPMGGWDFNPAMGGPKTLQFVINQPIRTVTTADKAVTFTSAMPGTTLTTQQVCDQINTAWGKTIATSVTMAPETQPRVQIMSDVYGVLSSVTIRSGGSANTLLGWATASEQRVEAAGFRGQDQNDGTTQTPWIEFFRGQFYQAGVAANFPTGGTVDPYYGQTGEDGVFNTDKLSALQFDAAGIDLRNGDLMFADGIQVKGAEVMKVENARIKLGTLNTALSTFNEDGKVIVAVRDQVKVNTLFDPAPFAPKYVWFKAEGLVYPIAGNTAATLTGSTAGTAATQATVIGTMAVADFALSGLTLKYTLTIDDVEQNETVRTFTNVTDLTTLLAAINADTNVLATDNGGGVLKIVTVKYGKNQKIKIGTGTANAKLFFTAHEGTTFAGKDVEFVAQPARLTHTATQTFNVALNMGDVITIQVTNDNFATTTDITYTWPAGTTYMNIGTLLTALNTNVAGVAPNDVLWTDDGTGKLRVSTVTRTGKLAGVRIKNAAMDNTALGAGKILFSLTASANGINGIQGETLKFKINDRVKIFSPLFLTNSLDDAVATINEAVGYPIASKNSGSQNKLTLTSDLKGIASRVEVLDDNVSAQANLAFGFGSNNRNAYGTGRPDPDFRVDTSGNVIFGADILRHPVTGYPYDPAAAKIYLQYRGLRKDVSPSAKKPGLLAISDINTLHAVLDPITEENPLALGMYLAMLNAPDVVVYGLGVDEISDAEPEGTLDAYERVAEFIESQEVWGIAPLTHSETVAEMFKAHVDNMSLPKNKSERVVFINPKVPKREVDTTIVTGLAANSIVGQQNKLTIDVNPVVELLNNEINAAAPIAYSEQLFIKVTVNGEVRNYSISNVNGVVLDLRTSFGVGENLDGFFSTDTLTENVINSTWGMYIRGGLLLIPGSTLADKQKIAETVNTKATQYADKRVRYLFPETIQVPIDGIVKNVAGYYAAAVYVGVRAYQKPQQGLTNFKVAGATGVVDSVGYYNRDQLDTIAGGGVWIMINDGAGLPIYSRHQLTTKVDTIEEQEDSIIAIVDHAAKLIRNLLRRFIGVNNVTKDVEDSISTLLDGIRKYLVEDLRSLIDMRVEGIFQDPKKPDTIVVNIKVTVPYPLNHIDVTIFI